MSKSPSLRRIKADIRELSLDPSDQYYAAPLESDMFEWHFTIRGPVDSEFSGGVYHGRILLPPEYPFKPPNIVFLTPSGRFETNTKVCLSFSAHHPELWQPAWGIRLILEALISFLPTPADGAIGALDWTAEERRKLAKESAKFHCPACCVMGQSCVDLLPDIKPAKIGGGHANKTYFQQEIEKLKMLQFQNHAIEDEKEVNDVKSEENEEKKVTADEASQVPLVSEDVAEVDQVENKNAKPTPLHGANPPRQISGISNNINCAPEQSASDNMAESLSSKNNADVARETSSFVGNNNRTNAPIALPPTVNNRRNNPVNPSHDSVLVSDAFLNGMIAAFMVTTAFLLRQAFALLEELNDLRS
jgi:ubiquitin-conjugating enzyme E2 J1